MNRRRKRKRKRTRTYGFFYRLRIKWKMFRSSPRGRKFFRILIWLCLVLVLICITRNVYFFLTGSKVDPEDPYPVKGVDVSSYQLEVDWKGLESEGFRFAFIKATEGSDHVDSRFAYNWQEAHRTDMKVGAYHFLSYDTDGETQAENFIETVDRKWGMLPPVVDVEFYGKYLEDHPDAETVHEILDVVLEKLEQRYHKKPIIYTNTNVYNMYLSGVYDEYPVWISNPDIPSTLPDGKQWIFCQYTFEGKSQYVADGQKYVDMNVFYGSEWEFRKYNGK